MKELFYTKPFDFYLDKIRNNQHFRYSRFNDGELIAIIGESPQGANCDGHQYFPEMGIELKQVLLNYVFDENYVLESFDHWYNILPYIKQILHELKQNNNDLSFLHTDFIRIAHEQEPDKFIELLGELKNKKLVIVGPSYLKKLDKHFSFRFIEVPVKNCYTSKNKIISEMKEISDVEDDVYFLLSASMPANIIINKFDDGRNTYLDWGSVWDTFYNSTEYPFIKKRSTSNNDQITSKYSKYLV